MAAADNMAGKIIDKAVILARGLGTRMRKADSQAKLSDEQTAAAEVGVKAMIPIGRPFADYILHTLAEAGYRRICMVIGPEHDSVRDYYQRLNPKRISIDFAVQVKPLGTADAVLAAEAFAGEDEFVVVNSDTYYPIEALASLRQLDGPGLIGFERDALINGSNIPADRLVKFAVIEMDAGDMLKRVIEKPDQATLESMPEPQCISMNCWRFTSRIFKACQCISPSARGELEITDAVQYAVDSLGESFTVIRMESPVLDITSREDIDPVAAKLSDIKVSL